MIKGFCSSRTLYLFTVHSKHISSSLSKAVRKWTKSGKFNGGLPAAKAAKPMSDKNAFIDTINKGYDFKDAVVIGAAIIDGEAQPGVQVKLPLKTFNRHGLISGATGTGKTKTIQVLAESLSAKGVPCLLMDIKGDMSGLAAPGTPGPKIEERMQKIGRDWKARKFPVELMTISSDPGVRLRATVSEFGPVLFSRILELNDTQSGVVSLVFKYADDQQMPLLDLKDFRKTLQYLTNEGKEAIEKEYGRISTASASTIIRKIVEIEEQGAEEFFGEKSFDPDDLLRVDEDGYGFLSILRLSNIQDRPKLFSSFMLSLLSEIYATFPEEGDLDQPKLVLFIDEAHLIFKEASATLLDQMETMIKLIRSKGVGVFFCTQSPVDIPRPILAQLGLKVQHALRAFSAQDRKDIKMVAANYPDSAFYKTETTLTELGIGEAMVTALNEKGIPTPLVQTLLAAPESRMDVFTDAEVSGLVQSSALTKKYNQSIDRESAYEMLTAKIQSLQTDEEEPAKKQGKEKPEGSVLGDAIDSTVGRQVMRTVARELTRGLLGALGVSGTTRRRKKSWF
jgi:DNA helicase HerA-like ATPase